LNGQRNAEDCSTLTYNTAAPVLNCPAVAVNDLSHDPEPESISLRFVALEGVEERLPHRLRNPNSIVRNRDDGIGSTRGDTHVEVPGMRQCLDGVEQEIRNGLEDFTFFNAGQCRFRRPRLNIDSFLGNLLMVEAKCGSSQIDQIDLFRFDIQANEGKTPAGDLAKATQLTIRLVQIFRIPE